MLSDKLNASITAVIGRVLLWADPGWWICLSLIIFLIAFLRPVPIRLEVDNGNTSDHVAVWIRRFALISFVGVILLLPLVLFIAFGMISISTPHHSAEQFKNWTVDMLAAYWTLPAAALLCGLTISFLSDRYIKPKLSQVLRKYRVKQHEDRPTDARTEAGRLAAKTFDPKRYFKAGFIFYGLDEKNLPVYVPLKDFYEIHHAIIGPTRFGKGVEIGTLLTQCIHLGIAVFFIDPKGDERLPYVLQNEAKAAGRKFVYLDLNPGGRGNWHPFKGGDPRARRSRMVEILDLASSGTNADVYKANERDVLDRALAGTDGSLRELTQFIGKASDRDLSALRDTLNEWSKVSTFMIPTKKRGHTIEDCLRNNAVVYVRGSIRDNVVRLATLCYLIELCAEVERLQKERQTHCTIAVDELKFLASNQITTALATLAGFRANLILAAQSYVQLENPGDRKINGKALAKEVEVGCQIKLIYRANDKETALWGEAISGTQWLRTPRLEKVEVNKHGGEQWSDSRALERTEHPVISQNTLLSLDQRVAVAYLPKRVPTTLFTCWIDTDRRYASWEPDEGAKSVKEVETPTAEPVVPGVNVDDRKQPYA